MYWYYEQFFNRSFSMEKSSAKVVLVTGGAGYIGSHCCKALAEHSFAPVTYDNLTTGNEEAVKWGPLIVGDIADREKLLASFEQYQPVAVLHFAATAYIGESVSDPAKYYRNNVGGIISLLDTCRDAKISKFVFSSSCATYGASGVVPVEETTPQRPISPYGRTKLICENILQDYSEPFGLNYTALRYFNAAGADPEGEIGEWHSPETHLIPRAMLAASATGEALEVFGTDYPTRDGTCIRDYIHVTDLAIANVLALNYLLAGGSSLTVNLGTGKGHTTLDVLAAIERITGKRVPLLFKQRRAGDSPILIADAALARKELGFRPKYSELDNIVRTTAPFFGLTIIA
jgi:UDP-arabinose 4-epimerase